jgi:hypothetical protein
MGTRGIRGLMQNYKGVPFADARGPGIRQRSIKESSIQNLKESDQSILLHAPEDLQSYYVRVLCMDIRLDLC